MATFVGKIIQFRPVQVAGVGATLLAPTWTRTTLVIPGVVVFDRVLTPPVWTASTAVPSSSVVGLSVLAPSWVASTNVPSAASIGDLGDVSAPEWAPSATVFSALSLSGPLIAPSWTRSTGVRSSSLAGPVTAETWTPSSIVFSTAVAAGPITVPTWVTSTRVRQPFVGALLQAQVVSPVTEVFTPTALLARSVSVPPWVPSTSIPTPAGLVPSLVVPAWVESTFVPAGVALGGPASAPRVESTSEVFAPDIRRDVDFSISQVTGATTGGQRVVLSGSALDMSACTPDFSDGSLDSSFWADISSGSGEVLEVSAAQALRLNTGISPGSVAGVRTVRAASDIDVEVQATVLVEDAQVLSAFELALYVSGDTDLRLSVLAGQVTLSVREGGKTLFDEAIATSGGSPQLRLLRADENVFVFLGGALVTVASWVTLDAQVELRVRNSPTLSSQAAARVSRYLRRPVVLFAAQPLTDIQVAGRNQAQAVIPARSLPGPVDVRLTGCDTVSDTLPAAFRYFLDPSLARVFGVPGGARITAISDPYVSGRIGRST